MTINSPVNDLSRDLPAGINAGSVADRKRSVTSDPTGNSIGKAKKTASEVIGEGVQAETSLPTEPIDVEGAVEKLNKIVQSQQTNVSFSVDKNANATVIKVFKTETGELIKQFPPEDILAMKAKISSSAGWLFDNTV